MNHKYIAKPDVNSLSECIAKIVNPQFDLFLILKLHSYCVILHIHNSIIILTHEHFPVDINC